LINKIYEIKLINFRQAEWRPSSRCWDWTGSLHRSHSQSTF